MTRVNLSITVDRELLSEARRLNDDLADSALVETGLAALVSQQRHDQLRRQYEEASERHTAREVDDWGDVTTFLDAAGRS